MKKLIKHEDMYGLILTRDELELLRSFYAYTPLDREDTKHVHHAIASEIWKWRHDLMNGNTDNKIDAIVPKPRA